MDMITILALVMLIFLLVVMAISYAKGRNYQEVTGTLKQIDTPERKRDDGTSFVAYVPVYEYEFAGETRTVRGAMSEDPERYKIGEARSIVCNKSDVSEVHIYKHNQNRKKVGMLLVGAGVAIVLIAVIITQLYGGL